MAKRKANGVGRTPAKPISASGAGGGDDEGPKLPLAPGVKYRRILLKLSGEALMGGTTDSIDPATLSQIADELIDVHSLGVEIALVIGGGKIIPRHPSVSS